MDREEAALRAKIQAMRSLLAAKQGGDGGASSTYGTRATTAPFAASYAPYHARKPTVSTRSSWSRTPPTLPPRVATVKSANKVWVNENAVRATTPTPVATMPPSNGRSFAQRVRSHMQLVRLEDGEYAKANGGFSLVRSNVMAAKATEKTSAQTARVQRPTVVSSSAASRAQAAVARARAAARSKSRPVRVRTEYCRFFNKFGYCDNKNACKFLHDSRRIALCRKFAKGACDDSKCLLSHDKNKMPVCTMFLRGACTRDDCRFRHVKVSGSAQICEAFLKGYCSQGEACQLRHELQKPAPTKRPLSSVSGPLDGDGPGKVHKLETSPSDPAASPSGTSPSSPSSSSPTSATAASTKPALSIRPNIRFAPRGPGGALPSLLTLRNKRPAAPTSAR